MFRTFRSFATRTETDISKQDLAKVQLKLLPNPIANFPKRLNAFSLYVREANSKVKAQHPDWKQPEVIKQLSSQWKSLPDRSVIEINLDL